MTFGKMPHGWIAEGGLTQFSGGKGVCGRMLAAAKCYLAIVGYRNDLAGDTVLSTSDFQAITGLSRPMVLEGIVMLEALGRIQIEARSAANTNTYVVGFTGREFRKVPQDVLAQCLPEIPGRGQVGLDALKLYMALLYYRDEATNAATVSHKKLCEVTGIRPDGIKKAYSVLHTAGLVVVDRMAASHLDSAPMNVYNLMGDFAGRRPAVPRPTELRRRARAADRAIPF